MTILHCIIYGLQVKSFKSLGIIVFSLFGLILLVSQLSRFCLFGWDCSIDLLVRYIWPVFHSIPWIVFQELSCYVFYFVVMIFVTAIWRHSHFLFIRSCNFNWIACVTSFFAPSGASFLFMRVIKFSVTLDLPHSQKWLSNFEIDFYLL